MSFSFHFSPSLNFFKKRSVLRVNIPSLKNAKESPRKKVQLMGKLNKETSNNANLWLAVAVGLKVMSTITIAIKILNIKCRRTEM